MAKQKKIRATRGVRIAELYCHAPDAFLDPDIRTKIVRKCAVRNAICDVTENRHSTAHLNLSHKSIGPKDRQSLLAAYDSASLPLGICSCWTKRHNEEAARPWILCPKRLLALEPPNPVLPKEVADLVDLPAGSKVRVWRGLKFRRKDDQSNRFFEYTFDYLLMQVDEDGEPTGVPYIIEVMTSSTRGGGLTEHMVDVLLGREQRNLTGVVQSVYSPNYRQVFERMLGQLIAKSEIAEKWGGRAIWVLQDVLLEYIEQSTDFASKEFERQSDGSVFIEVYSLLASNAGGPLPRMKIAHAKSLRGRARASHVEPDVTSMLGLGYAPSLESLKETLKRGIARSRNDPNSAGTFEFIWGSQLELQY